MLVSPATFFIESSIIMCVNSCICNIAILRGNLSIIIFGSKPADSNSCSSNA